MASEAQAPLLIKMAGRAVAGADVGASPPAPLRQGHRVRYRTYVRFSPRRGRPRPTRPSARQQQILEFIKRHTATHGFAPTLEEIGEGVGLKSRTSVLEQVQRLERDGYVVRAPGKRRAIELTAKAGGRAYVGRKPPRALP